MRLGTRRSPDTDYTVEMACSECECDDEIDNVPTNPNQSLSLKCRKHPGHVDFIPANQLALSHLPPEIRHETVLKWLHLEMDRTVKITVKKTSPHRCPSDRYYNYEGSRTASGRVWVIVGATDITLPSCPLADCCPYTDTLGPNHPAFGYLQITTNKHVIFDDFEAKNCVIEFFYDSREDKKRGRVVKAHGDSVRYDIESEDQSIVSCVFHQRHFGSNLDLTEVFDTLRQIPPSIRESMASHCIVISHPHGMAKRVSLGDVVERVKPWSERSRLHRWVDRLLGGVVSFSDGWVTRYTTPTCPGSSGGAVLVCMGGRFWWPISHSGHDSRTSLNVSKSYFK